MVMLAGNTTFSLLQFVKKKAEDRFHTTCQIRSVPAPLLRGKGDSNLEI